jgi:hypothetical protein
MKIINKMYFKDMYRLEFWVGYLTNGNLDHYLLLLKKAHLCKI